MAINLCDPENLAGQVTTTAWNCCLAYGYNEKSELTNAVAAVDSDYRYSYDFDDIGNRETSTERGTNHTYAANSLNQYAMVGRVVPNAPQKEFIPQFDNDGNQTLVKTATGVWSVTYNGENRPVRWVNGDTVITMSFDRMGRRVTKNDQRFVYDGYLQVANFEHQTSNIKLQTFLWDPTEPVATRPLVWNSSTLQPFNFSTSYYTHDGNKNVSEVAVENCDIAAHYEYAPFGAETIQSGYSSADNLWRFSSEYAEDETGCCYYNFREYSSFVGRWMSMDLLNDSAGKNTYGYVDNSTAMYFDYLGMVKRPARNADRNGHRSMKNGGNWDRHSKAQGHGGHKKPNFTPQHRKRTCMRAGKVEAGVLGRINAATTGFAIGALAVGEMSAAGVFDETLDWSIFNDGEMCCEHPSVPLVSEVNVRYQFSYADIHGPLFGLGGSGQVRYEHVKEIYLHWICCCGKSELQNESLEVKAAGPFFEDWLGGLFGSAQYFVYSVKLSLSFLCEQN